MCPQQDHQCHGYSYHTNQTDMHTDPVKNILITTTPGWLNPIWLTVLCALTITYGSLIPFDFKSHFNISALLSAWTTLPHWHEESNARSSLGFNLSLVDYATNIILYIPLGMLLRITIHKFLNHIVSQITLSIIIATLMCWLIETTQHGLNSRVASLNDIAWNSTGAVIGAIFGINLRNTAINTTAVFVNYFIHPLSTLHTYLVRLSHSRFRISLILLLTSFSICLLSYGLFHNTTPGDKQFQTSILPFVAYQQRSYDVAAVLLAQSIGIYLITGLLLAFTMPAFHNNKKHVASLIVPGLGAIIFHVLQVWQVKNTYDFTEPLLAVIIISATLTLYHIPIFLIYTAWSYSIIHPIQNNHKDCLITQ